MLVWYVSLYRGFSRGAWWRYKTIKTICILKTEPISQMRNILLFYTSNMAAVTSQEKPLFACGPNQLSSIRMRLVKLSYFSKLSIFIDKTICINLPFSLSYRNVSLGGTKLLKKNMLRGINWVALLLLSIVSGRTLLLQLKPPPTFQTVNKN